MLRSSLFKVCLVGFGLSSVFMVEPGFAQDATAAPKVAIAAAYSREVTEEAVFIGRGEAKDQADILARVQGFLEHVLVGNGAQVNEGDVLFQIEPDSYEATLDTRKAELAKAQANLDLAKIELQRKAELFARGSAPESDRDIARANELEAEAAVKAAEAAIRPGRA